MKNKPSLKFFLNLFDRRDKMKIKKIIALLFGCLLLLAVSVWYFQATRTTAFEDVVMNELYKDVTRIVIEERNATEDGGSLWGVITDQGEIHTFLELLKTIEVKKNLFKDPYLLENGMTLQTEYNSISYDFNHDTLIDRGDVYAIVSGDFETIIEGLDVDWQDNEEFMSID